MKTSIATAAAFAAQRAGMDKAREELLAGRPALAYVAILEATETEASIVGFGPIRIPAGEGFRRLVAYRRFRDLRRRLVIVQPSESSSNVVTTASLALRKAGA